MRRTVFLAFFFLLFLCCLASALEMQGESFTPYQNRELTVSAGRDGILTVEAVTGDWGWKPVISGVRLEKGSTVFLWDALSWNGEPIPVGNLTLKACLETGDGEHESALLETRVTKAAAAVQACLPAAASFRQGDPLRIEIPMSAPGSARIRIAPESEAENTVWETSVSADGNLITVFWNGLDINGKALPAGKYVIQATSAMAPAYTHTATVEISNQTLDEELFLTGEPLPEDLSDEEAVWAALTAPVIVGWGEEGNGLRVFSAKDINAPVAGTVSCRTVGVKVIALDCDGWAKVGVFCQQTGNYIEGFAEEKTLRVIWPNTNCGAVLDKRKQVMTVYRDGKKLGELLVSTGLVRREFPKAETRSGVYLTGTRLGGFNRDGKRYEYAIRIDGSNLIHQVGYDLKSRYWDFSAELPELGRPASHGCVRMDPRASSGDSLTAWWVWTHFGRDTKILITDDAQERDARRREAGLE